MTVIQIAKLAKVSKSTVSRVLNNPGAVRPELVERVRAAMAAHRYAPPAVRRGPKPKPRNLLPAGKNIGVLLYGRTRELLQFPSTARMMAGVVEGLGEAGISPQIIEMPDPLVFPKVLNGDALGGIIVFNHQGEMELARRLRSIPCIFIGGVEAEVPVVDQVLVNNRLVAALAADYLAERGCRHPAFLNHDLLHPAFAQRQQVFAEHCRRHGLEAQVFIPGRSAVADEVTMWSTSCLRTELEKLVDRLLAAPVRPDGLFIPTDQQAAMVWTLLKERGLSPGREMPMVSCNNDECWLATMHPRPASIDMGCDEIGRECARRLLARLQSPAGAPIAVLVAPRLVVGE